MAKRARKPVAKPVRGRAPGTTYSGSSASGSSASGSSASGSVYSARVQGPVDGAPVSSTADSLSPRAPTPPILRTHTRYDTWNPVWEELGELYEGDGRYADGSALVPHIRELLYKQTVATDGAISTDFSEVVGEKIKYRQRRRIARYENFAAMIVDTLADHQYAKDITRDVEKADGQALLAQAPLSEWWEDVDGLGTHIDDWMESCQTLGNLYGHVFVLMDRLVTNPTRRVTNTSSRGQKTSVTTLADQGRPILRWFIPPDAPDWLAPFGRLTSVKFREAVERASLLDPILPERYNYLLWDAQAWTRFDNQGATQGSQPHGFGELPVTIFYAQKRARIPVIGRSVLGSPTIYRDHYNLLSELRELLRSQTFSMLQITLADNETVEMARARLGDHAGTDSLVFSRGGAEFIAPAEGPATVYASEIAALERKAFRLNGLPWESDTKDAEAEGSLQLKASNLDRRLAKRANLAEYTDYQIARLYMLAVYGPDAGARLYESTPIRINHPDDFNVQELATAVSDARATIDLGLGRKATTLIKARVLGLALPNLNPDDTQIILKEIEQESTAETDHKQTVRKLEQQKAAGPPRAAAE